MVEQQRKEIDDQAAAWAARSLSGSFSQDDEASLAAWLRTDKRHAEAYDVYLAIADRASAAADFAAEESLEQELEEYAAQSDTRRLYEDAFSPQAYARALASAASEL